MLQDGTLKGRNYVVNYNSQVLTKYMLLDHLASSLGCHQGDSLVKSRVVLTSPIGERLLEILKDTSHWHHIGRAMYHSLSDQDNHSSGLSDGPPPVNSREQDEVFYRNVNWLWGAHLSFLKSDIASAEGQMQLMAFMVNWHATVGLAPFVICDFCLMHLS